MKLEVTERGMRDQDGKPIEVGTVLTVKADAIPASMINKVRQLGGIGQTPVMNVDDDAEEKARLTADLEAAGVKVDGRWSLDRLKEEYAKATA